MNTQGRYYTASLGEVKCTIAITSSALHMYIIAMAQMPLYVHQWFPNAAMASAAPSAAFILNTSKASQLLRVVST